MAIDTGTQGGFPEKEQQDPDMTTGTTLGTTTGTTTGDGHPPRVQE